MPTRRALLASAALAPTLGVGGSAAAQDATPEASQAAFETEPNVVYGEAGGEPLLLDVYRPPARTTLRPAVILIHGGAWTYGYADRSVNIEPARELAAAGYVAFNIAYRLMGGEAKPDTWPAQLDDVQRAVRWVRAHADEYGVDPERIGSYGGSSGGHLAAMLGVRDTRDNADPELASFSSRVTCVVDLAGDMDLTIPYPNPSDDQIAINLLGGLAAATPEAYRDVSPITWVDAETVPFLVVHGGADEANPVEHSRRMVAALHNAEVEVIYAEFPGVGHLGAFAWDLHGPWALTFFARHLHPDR